MDARGYRLIPIADLIAPTSSREESDAGVDADAGAPADPYETTAEQALEAALAFKLAQAAQLWREVADTALDSDTVAYDPRRVASFLLAAGAASAAAAGAATAAGADAAAAARAATASAAPTAPSCVALNLSVGQSRLHIGSDDVSGMDRLCRYWPWRSRCTGGRPLLEAQQETADLRIEFCDDAILTDQCAALPHTRC